MADFNKENIIASIVVQLAAVLDADGEKLIKRVIRGAPVAVPDKELPIGFVQGMDDQSQKQGVGWEQCLWRIGICFQMKKPEINADRLDNLTELDKRMLDAENRIRGALNGFAPEGGFVTNWFRTFTPFEHAGVPAGYIMPAFNVLRNESVTS